jgi:hypothetical protein
VLSGTRFTTIGEKGEQLQPLLWIQMLKYCAALRNSRRMVDWQMHSDPSYNLVLRHAALKRLPYSKANTRMPKRRPASRQLAPQFEGIIDQTYEAIRSFPKGTAPGPHGLRVQHLLDIMATLTDEDRDTFLTALTSLTHMIRKGLLSDVIAQYASSGYLPALNKPGGQGGNTQLQSVSPSVG